MACDVQAIDLSRYAWYPQEGPQTAAYCTKGWCTELLFGGAKYGGKSDFLLGDYLQDVHEYGRNWQGILVRQSLPELDDILRRSFEFYPQTGAEWKEGKKNWQWPNGACLRMRYLETVKDFYHYNGHSFTWIGVDELGQWESGEGYLMLVNGCLRWGAADVPVKRARASANPLGAGHEWIKQHFEIDKYPLGSQPIWDEEARLWRMFIKSRITDNKLGLKRDPGYLYRLKRSGKPALVKAWLEGDWTGDISGSFLGDVFGDQHIHRPFTIPESWLRFRAMDWGSARPFSVGWWAVADGSPVKLANGSTKVFPPNFLMCYREWYGMKPGCPNVGLKLTVPEVARGIIERSAEDYAYDVGDPSMWIEDGGPSIGEVFQRHGIIWRRGDNKRIPGAQQLRLRLQGEEGEPMIGWFDTCLDSIRTLPMLPHDEHKPEDVDSSKEDHAYDQVRMSVMSRPWSGQHEDEKAQGEFYAQSLLDETLRTTRGYKRL